MSFIQKVLVVIFALAISSIASASSVLLEPYLGYSPNGKWEQGTSSSDFKMTNYGVKLAYQSDGGFQIGVDLKLGSGKFDSAPPVTETSGIEGASGPHLGYQTPFGLRFYGSYYFRSLLVFDDITDTRYTGNGYKAGIGYTILERVALNVEYQVSTYDEFEATLTSGALTNNFETSAITANLSFPIVFD